MASIRSRSESRTRSGDESRSKRRGGVMETSRQEFSPALSQIARKEADNARLGSSSIPQPRMQQSRIPQNASVRKLPGQKTLARPPLTHETQSWSTSTGQSSARVPKPSTSAARGQPDPSQPSRVALLRKPPSLSQEPPSMLNQSRSNSGRTGSSSSIPKSQTSMDSSVPYTDRSITASPVEIRTAQKFELPRTAIQPSMVYPELDRYRDIEIPISREGPSIDLPFKLATENLPPPTPLFSGGSSHSQLSTFSASPSTRFSESPGPGPYSRDTTPTSMSSQSPGLIVPHRLPISRARQASPAETRPPVTRRRAGSIPNEEEAFGTDSHGLAAVREVLTSSSSNSTVRPDDRKEKKVRRGPTPALNPPPRKSSQKFNREKVEVEPLSKVPRIPTRSSLRSPSPAKVSDSAQDRARRTAPTSRIRPAPPSRPSRDRTPDLYSQFGGPMPIIQSNLSSTSLADKRYSGQIIPSSLPRSTTPSTQERSISSKAPVSREPTPAPRPGVSKAAQPSQVERGKTTRTPSPATTFKTRFPLFGRRTKTAPEVPQVEKKEKPTRKGPAAGTGHEGYGRIGAIRRRSGMPGPISPLDSLASPQSTDQFLLERMNPVIISGGEIVDNQNTSFELTRTESSQSVVSSRPGIGSRNNSFISVSSREETRQTLWPSAFPRPSIQTRRPSESSDSEAGVMGPTIAFRRSIQRLQSPSRAPLNLPKPIITTQTTSPSVGSVDTSTFTDDSQLESRPDASRAKAELKAAPKKLTKRAKSPRKWNLFSRSQSQPSKDRKKVEASVSAAVKPTKGKSVAFYTMMDSSEQDETEDQDVCDILREAEVLVPFMPTGEHGRNLSESSQSLLEIPPSHQLQTEKITPEPMKRNPPNAKESQRSSMSKSRNVTPSTPSSATPKARPSRLPQVGRIPKVVTTRPEQTSPKSFSRPFHRVSLRIPPPDLSRVDRGSVAKGPSPPRPWYPEQTREEPAETSIEQEPPSGDTPLGLGFGNEFLSFPPPKDSERTTSSGSGSSELINVSNHTALPPAPNAPLTEDEIWDEYNDFLGDTPPSATSSRGTPFHLETYESKLAKKLGRVPESPTIVTHHARDIRDSIETGKAATSSSHYSADMTARINAAFRFGSDQPATPFSVSEFVSGYGDHDNSNVQLTNASASIKRDSSSSNKSAKTKRSSSSSRNSEVSPLSQVNLRVGSMTVSKWLSFGHVLFSPVREDLINDDGSKRQSILVIDGLGNDDWSFYAAETYPNATFFNLSPRAPLTPEQRSTPSFPLSPPNHHQIQFASHMDKFPFGPDSFTAVVFRFPSAAPETHYRNIISEARRVLKPGGYIELSILDVDLNNMGTRSRRAVRRLKEQVNARNPDYSLSSTADLILRLLGKRGFTDVKKCRVGVPVASAITSSSSAKGKKKDERSLAEMMNDKTEMGDENITNMVSRVGRWWYNKCYETSTGKSTSIWNDKSLLAECEEWGTSLKLMVCHARKPEVGGRVASI
ncbi:uncharacterized protein GGS22DRAFT_75640 [Annulohypoxylon maeteangense]|uniref:uncharacterized protein n=1 Tax=Annulohypoxylon maeteangense TaxID=1927788 RepID=UPI002008921C|nr:uncharacterized protein GGS22DRAFT_75640 [Annulohypoxylon maeteangense]KAI0881094.1 hypothetical protein GGS22DRAFT_75640 [Annulohypoxylon maeteangense]